MKKSLQAEKSILRRTRGFTLIESVVAMAILAMLVASGSSVIQLTTGSKNLINRSKAAANASQLIVNLVNSTPAWEMTISRPENPSLHCLVLRSCGNGAAGSFILFYANGEKAFDPTTQGFDHSGKVCDFVGGVANANCPLSLALTWKAVCNGGSCVNPQILISGRFSEFDPNNDSEKRIFLNINNFNFDFYRGVVDNSLKVACESVRGTFDPATYECRLIPMDRECPAKQVVKRVNADMTFDCQLLLSNSVCPAGQYFMGLNADATPVCGAIPACKATPTPTPRPGDGGTTDGTAGGSGDGGGGCGDGGGGGGCGDGGGGDGDGG